MSEQLVIYGGANIIGPIEFSSASIASQSFNFGITYDPTTGRLGYIQTSSFGSGSGGSGGPESDPIFTARSASLATTGSNAFKQSQIISGSLTITATTNTDTLNAFGGEFVVLAEGVKIGNVITDTHTLTGSLSISGSIVGYVQNTQTGSFITSTQTGSFITSTQTSSFVTNSQTSSFITSTQTGSFVTSAQTSSFITNAQTSSFITSAQTSSFVTNSQTSSFVLNSQTASFATTGSNTFRAEQTISGSLTVTSSLSVFGGEFNVNNTGVKIGNLTSDLHTITGSLYISGATQSTGSGHVITYNTASGQLFYDRNLQRKSGVLLGSSFTASPSQFKSAVTFTRPFPNTNYGVVVTGTALRQWTIESKTINGFTINSNASGQNNSLTAGANIFWIAMEYGES